MLNCLIVGGAGYIGSHMALMLAEYGWDVTVFDNLSRGHRDAVHGEFIEGDLLVPNDLERLFSCKKFDLVMHFAALAYVGESVEQPMLYYRNNFVGTMNLLEAMRNYGVDKMVFSSTCSTYGEPQTNPIPEDHPQNPINPYGAGKLMVEQVLNDSAAAYGLENIALRYFNAAGCDAKGRLGERHDPETHLIPLVLQAAKREVRGEKCDNAGLLVFGEDYETLDGTCVRDYIHVEDLCSAHLLAAKRLLKGLCSGAEAYNLGNGQGFSVLEVIEACKRVTGVDIPYQIVERREGDPAHLVGDATKAREVLGWQPKYTELDEIVRTAWEWMREKH